MKKRLPSLWLTICLMTCLAWQVNAQIKVYTMNGCGRCARTVQYLKDNNIEFTEHNTSTSDANSMAMWALLEGKVSGSVTMPVVDNNGEVAFSIKDLSSYLANLKNVKPTPKPKPEPVTTAGLKVYTMNGCGRCAKVVKFLKDNGVEFTELNTTTSKSNNNAMWTLLSGKVSGSITMPVVDNNGDVVFNIKDLDSYLQTLVSNKPTPSEDEMVVTIFQHSNFEGKSQKLKVGKYNVQALQIGNDQLSSVKVPEGMYVLLYEHGNYGGSYMELHEDTWFVGDEFNDKTSSIEVGLYEEPEPDPKPEPKPNNNNNNPSMPSFKGCATGKENVPAENEAFEKKVLDLVNAERKKAGKPALVWNADLARAARYHAADMANDDYFEHDSYDNVNGQSVKVCDTFDRIGAFGRGFAENIALGSTSPEGAMNQWMNSPGHKRNILSDNGSLGVGYYKGYWVQVFGSK